MGRKRKPEEEKSTTIFLRLPNPILWQLEKIGEPQEVVLNLIKEYLENTRKKT